jgi:hypothetical protein
VDSNTFYLSNHLQDDSPVSAQSGAIASSDPLGASDRWSRSSSFEWSTDVDRSIAFVITATHKSRSSLDAGSPLIFQTPEGSKYIPATATNAGSDEIRNAKTADGSLVIGVVIGCVVFVLLIIGLFLIYIKRDKSQHTDSGFAYKVESEMKEENESDVDVPDDAGLVPLYESTGDDIFGFGVEETAPLF